MQEREGTGTGTGAPARLDRNFWWLVSGSFVSMLGDQFTLVALPWLVLKLTGSALALGTVLMVMALPRAAFMLVGGAFVDRFSPHRVLVIARAANAVFIGILAAFVWTGAIQLWWLYLLALGIGFATAFVYPAGSAILPQIVPAAKLTAANGITMGLRTMSTFVGPALAGVVVALFAAPGIHAPGAVRVPDATGLASAFTIDALSFLASIFSLLIIRVPAFQRHEGRPLAGVLRSIGDGVREVWRDFPLRAFILYVGAVSFFVGGPLQVGLPVLADQRLDWGAAAYGALMSASGAGIFVGSLLAGIGTRLFGKRLGLTVLVADSVGGLIIAAFGFVHHTLVGIVMLFVWGIVGGFIQIALITWIQRRVAPEMMGRTMSLLMFVFLGVGPLAAALGGVVLHVTGVTTLFVGAGLLLTGIALVSMLNPAIRSIRAADAKVQAAD